MLVLGAQALERPIETRLFLALRNYSSVGTMLEAPRKMCPLLPQASV